MNRGYLLNRLQLLVIVIAVSLAFDYFQGEALDAARMLTKVFTMTVIVGVLSIAQYWWKRRGNA